MDDIKKRFLTNTDETGRFIVKSLTTGKTYYVEPIGNGHPADWGDINPGISPISVIYQRDLSYEQLNRMVHEIHG